MQHVVIMAGGTGSRFWPRSRDSVPKQLLSLGAGASLLQAAYRRAAAIFPDAPLYVTTSVSCRDEVLAQLPGLPRDRVICEPAVRDTGPSIGLAAAVLQAVDPGAVMVVVCSDQRVLDLERFGAALRAAAVVAGEDNRLVTVGTRPTRPETGFGYIRIGDQLCVREGVPVCAVKGFAEKPNLRRASQYLRRGGYLWNAGVFAWKAGLILEHIARHLPEVHAGLRAITQAFDTTDAEAVVAAEYAKMPRVSIDRGVIERAGGILTVVGDFAWEDMGDWNSLSRVLPQDPDGNVMVGDSVGIDTTGCIIHSEGKLVATLGLKDLIIVDTPDVLLVCDRNRSQEIAHLKERLRSAGLHQYL